MRALRTITVWLLMLVASGLIPVTATCAEGASGCGDVCLRCECKRRPAVNTLRAPCACCQPAHGAQPVTLLPPAVLPPPAPSICPPPESLTLSAVTALAGPFTHAVPDPPPRARLLF
jgi:hypothetical protein